MLVFSETPKSLAVSTPDMQFQPMNRPTYGKPSKHSKVKCLKQDNKHGIGREKHWSCLICPINPPHFGGDMILGLYPPPRFRFPGKNHHVRLVSHHVLHSSGYNTQQNTDVLEVNPSFLEVILLKPRNIHQIGGWTPSGLTSLNHTKIGGFIVIEVIGSNLTIINQINLMKKCHHQKLV